MRGTGRVRKRAAAVAAPVVATALAVATGARGAEAATAERTEAFTFVSSATQEEVTCTIHASFTSESRQSGGWSLTAFVRIAEASSSECFDGIAHLSAHHTSGPDDSFHGGGSFVQVATTTPTEVTSISYEIYFNACACYSPEYQAPK
jgi:hypothetical protein